ncbi:FecR family protein [Steroidobacter sp.]|uniref:FecR family protein n=1 Tax=Steroidobacter sp. TaxID=1978227 RepID=UPI001A518B49|nr:FecR domain-containing protein [Steroidobacter sp.]MBL8271995.1 FecR domain-containing protein [Steroidobacter sp.]
MNLGTDDDKRITERGAQYLGALTEGDGSRDALFAWLKESPRHVEDFLFLMNSAQDIADVTPEQEARIEAMAGGSDDTVVPMQADVNVVPIDAPRTLTEHAPTKTSGGHAMRWVAGLAATLLVTTLAVWQFTGIGQRQTYTTAIGEQRSIKLADGSMVYLNTRSRLEVRFTDNERWLRLREGEALFTVKHDSARPFSVHTDDAVIQAIGTQFGVYRQDSGTRVAVLEGVVQISGDLQGSQPSTAAPMSPPRLAAGEEASVTPGGAILERRPVNSAKAAAWRQRRLVFEDESLETIVAEFNRYNVTPQIQVLDEAARRQRFSGTFDADAPERMVNTLVDNESLVVTRTGEEITIRSRR